MPLEKSNESGQRINIIRELLSKCSGSADKVLDELMPQKVADGVLFFDPDNVPTPLLLGLVSKASELMSAELDSDESISTDDLEGMVNNPLTINLLEKNYKKTLLVLIERARYRNAIEHGGYDSLMEGYINTTPQMGKDVLREESSRIIAEAREKDLQLSILFADLDNFKLVNDEYTHAVGDLALTHVSDRISQVTKKGDLKVRDGGEEIFVVLSDADKNGACITAERVRQSVAQNPLYAMYVVSTDDEGTEVAGEPIAVSPERYKELMEENHALETVKGRGIKTITQDKRGGDGKIVLLKIPLSLSIGVTECPNLEEGVIQTTKRLADEQMYKAKDEGGRNCIYCDSKPYIPHIPQPMQVGTAISAEPYKRGIPKGPGPTPS